MHLALESIVDPFKPESHHHSLWDQPSLKASASHYDLSPSMGMKPLIQGLKQTNFNKHQKYLGESIFQILITVFLFLCLWSKYFLFLYPAT